MSIVSSNGTLQGLHVLLVEDDHVQAEHIADCLSDAGILVFGPAGTVEQAGRLIDENGFEVALVDIGLDDGPSFLVAAQLVWLSLPFAFVTGYDRSCIPPEFDDITVLEKPFSIRALMSCVAGIASRH